MTHPPEPAPAYTIRVVNCWGDDLESFRELLLIGPYPSRVDRDADIDRLSTLPDMKTNAGFARCRINPATVHTAGHITAVEAAEVRCLDDLVRALYHLPAGQLR